MITERFRIILIIIMILYFTGLFFSLAKKYLLIKHTLVWLFAGLMMTILVFFPDMLQSISNLLGIYSGTNLLFAAAIGFILLIIIYLAHVAMKVTETNRRLVQEVALLAEKLDEYKTSGNRKQENFQDTDK